MVIILSLLSGALLAGVVAYIGRYFELKEVSETTPYFTLDQLLTAIIFAFLAAQALASVVLSIKLFAVGDMAVIFFGTVITLVLLKGPAEYVMKQLMSDKNKAE